MMAIHSSPWEHRQQGHLGGCLVALTAAPMHAPTWRDFHDRPLAWLAPSALFGSYNNTGCSMVPCMHMGLVVRMCMRVQSNPFTPAAANMVAKALPCTARHNPMLACRIGALEHLVRYG